MLTLVYHLIVAFLVLALPLWDRNEIRRLKQSTNPRVRIQSYQLTMGWLWTATALVLVSTPFGPLQASDGSQITS